MVFKSTQLEEQFQKEGYVVLSLLNSHEAHLLLDYFKEFYQVDITGFHSTHFLKDRKKKEAVHQKIVSVYNEPLQEYLNSYEALFGNFMVKSIGEESRMPLHADWTYVNEPSHVSLGVWSPLINTTEENGMLGVVPRSHKFSINERGPKIPTPFHDYNEYIIENYGKLLDLKAGDVVIYNHRLLHFSPANRSKEVRPAINLVMRPKDAEVLHFANMGEFPKVEKFSACDKSFFLDYTHFEQPNKEYFSKDVEVSVVPYDKKYIDKVLTPSFWEKLFS